MNITTVPAILERYGYEYVDFVKIDVEGWERASPRPARVQSPQRALFTRPPPPAPSPGEVILGMGLDKGGADAIGGLTFETGNSWLDTRKGPSDMTLAEVVDYLSSAGAVGYACFYLGRGDLLPISPPADAPQPHHQDYGLNVICFRRDTALHRAILLAHTTHLTHCLAGQGLWA
jgi:hypothetical protein